MHLYYPDSDSTVDYIFDDLAQKWNVAPPMYKLGVPMPRNVLATYDTDTKMIEFGSTNPQPFVAAHEFSHYLHDTTGTHCDRANCENFAYMFEKAYGNTSKLYRLNAECPMQDSKVLTFLGAGPVIVDAAGLILLFGAGAYLASRHVFKKQKWDKKDATLAGIGAAGAALVALA